MKKIYFLIFLLSIFLVSDLSYTQDITTTTILTSGGGGVILTINEAGNKVINYLNKNIVQSGTEVILISVKEMSDLYEVVTYYQDKQIPIYITKDGSFLFLDQPLNTTQKVGTLEEVKEVAIDYLNKNIVQPGTSVSLVSVKEINGIYEVTTLYQGRQIPVYITKDGSFLFLNSPLNTSEEIPKEEEVETETPKTDKPEAHAFIMSYCPYGLQFLKAYVPVIELLGDKADLELNFVHYAMHGKKEIDENTRMYCIQKEQEDKLTKYLRCFVGTDDYEKCIVESGIDKAKLESCINSTDEEFNITGLYNDKSTWSGGTYPQYPVDEALAAEYDVRGSPTFVINGQTVSVTRSAEAVKEAICSAFNNPPAECEQTLSTTTEAAGIGAITSSYNTISIDNIDSTIGYVTIRNIGTVNIPVNEIKVYANNSIIVDCGWSDYITVGKFKNCTNDKIKNCEKMKVIGPNNSIEVRSCSGGSTTTTIPIVTTTTLPISEMPQNLTIPNYEWKDLSNVFSFGLEEPITKIGVYIPKEVNLRETYPIFLYIKRKDIALNSSLSSSPFIIRICAGPGIEFPSSNIYLHIGVGAKIIIYDTGWDNWMWHIPIFTSSTLSTYDSIHYNVDVSTDKIYYTNLSDIPIDSWDVHRVDINIATLSPSEITTTTIQSINKDKILESLTSLEQLKIKFDSLKIISQSIRDYYDSVNKLDKSTCWKEVTLSFEATLLKIDNIISEINTIKDNPTQDDLDKIKNEIKGVKSNVDKIINKIITCATGV